MSIRTTYIFSVVMLVTFSVWPCGPYPTYAFYNGGRDLYGLPETIFNYEYTLIRDIKSGIYNVEEYKSFFVSQTIQADLNDLKDSLGDDAKAKDKLDIYRALRTKLADQVEHVDYQKSVQSNGSDIFSITFSTESFEKVLIEIPEEFALYIRGAAAFQGNQWEYAKHYFSSVLKLAPEQRTYRSVWAAYMLGRTSTNMEQYGEAISFFAQTRALAAEGFRDSLNLVDASWGWQGHAHYLAGEYVEALHSYIERERTTKSIVESVKTMLRAISDNPEQLKLLVHEELLRQLYTAYLISLTPYPEISKSWLELNTTMINEGIYVGADRLAWLSYQIGDMESAAKWLQHSTPGSPYALLVKAKLLLREGKNSDSIEVLESLKNTIHDPMWVIAINNGWKWIEQTSEVLSGELAGGLLKNDQYSDALKEFLIADDWPDAAFVARNIMTISELKLFIDKHKSDSTFLNTLKNTPNYNNESYARLMKYLKSLLASRYAQLGQWGRVGEYEPYLAEYSLSIEKQINIANDNKLSDKERAENFFEAAKLIADHCESLLKNETTAQLGTPDQNNELAKRREHVLSDNARKRIEENMNGPECPLSHWYVAAALMKQCADLLPNNDVLAAEALFLGGSYLKYRDPKAADPFYKALVRRNPNLLIARQADELRWFPKEFTDVVLYTPRIEPLLPRKRTLAVGFGAVILVVGTCVLVPMFVKRRRKHIPVSEEDTNETEEPESSGNLP